MNKKSKPVRMCIVCKGRFEQKILHRFYTQKGEICQNLGFGRSMYLCETCLRCKDKILQKAFLRVCPNINTVITQENLKEVMINGKG